MALDLYKRGNVWWMRGRVHGLGETFVDVNQSTFQRLERKDLADKVRQARETQLVEELIYGKRPSVSFAQVARDGVKNADGKLAVGYLKFQARSGGTQRRVNKLIAHFDQTPIDAIDQAAADAAVMALCRKGAASSPATKIRQVYGPLGTIFTFGAAATRGWCAAKSFEKPPVPKAATPWLAPRQGLALIAHAAPHLKPLLIFLLCTGARLSEALDLQWKDVDLGAAKAIFRDSKAEKLSDEAESRVAALPPAAVTTLANLPYTDEEKKTREGHVFRRDDGEPYVDRAREEGGQIRSAWRTACRKAGLPGHYEQVERRRIETRAGERRAYRKKVSVWIPDHTPHDCRHSWSSWFYGLTKDMLLLMTEGGWADTDMVQRYAHLMPSELVFDVALVWGPTHPKIGTLPIRTPAVQAIEARA